MMLDRSDRILCTIDNYINLCICNKMIWFDMKCFHPTYENIAHYGFILHSHNVVLGYIHDLYGPPHIHTHMTNYISYSRLY